MTTYAHLPSVATRLNDDSASSSSAQSTVTITMSPQPSAPSNGAFDSNNSGLRKISTILPAFLIGFVCFLAIFLACGMFHSRRRRRLLLMQSLAFPGELTDDERGGRRRTKKKKRLVKPRLFEVEVRGAQWDADLEALLPVAAELPPGSGPSKPPSPLVVVPQAHAQRPWYLPNFSLGRAPQPPTPADVLAEGTPPVMQQAQLAFLVSMPAPHRAPGAPAAELALGTTRVPYRGEQEGDDEAEELLRKIDWTA
ncbi:hypothetical protein PsYK624_013520 [Phanerochaete sordida]|uniref:Transmembrane protein n=1 Tax=Phanerochaete sordida TaxID=48140 RepID=A0A9P3L8R4_9APHY|nr:hypothetical protein PsYK624_013520 [Phanerochaete sordida]